MVILIGKDCIVNHHEMGTYISHKAWREMYSKTKCKRKEEPQLEFIRNSYRNNHKHAYLFQTTTPTYRISLNDRFFFRIPSRRGNEMDTHPFIFLRIVGPLHVIGLIQRETLQGLTLGIFAKCIELKEK